MVYTKHLSPLISHSQYSTLMSDFDFKSKLFLTLLHVLLDAPRPGSVFVCSLEKFLESPLFPTVFLNDMI